MIRSEVRERVAIITIDNPPVNALPVAGWFALADALRATGRDPDVHVVIRVKDTETGEERTYSSPLNTPFAPIQDTVAFDTCP